jgi:hypothetical protein
VANVWHRKVDYTDSLLPGYAAICEPSFSIIICPEFEFVTTFGNNLASTA